MHRKSTKQITKDPNTGGIYMIIPRSYILMINDPRINDVERIKQNGIKSRLQKVKIPKLQDQPALCPQQLLTLDYHMNQLFVVSKDFLMVFHLAIGLHAFQHVPSKRKYLYPLKIFFDDKQSQCNIVANGYDNTQTFTRVQKIHNKWQVVDKRCEELFANREGERQVEMVQLFAISANNRLVGNANGAAIQLFNIGTETEKEQIGMEKVVVDGKESMVPKYAEKVVQEDAQKEAWYLNIASKTVKTYKEDPEFPEGASRITITQSKLIVALGNVIRAYSFDLLPDSD